MEGFYPDSYSVPVVPCQHLGLCVVFLCCFCPSQALTARPIHGLRPILVKLDGFAVPLVKHTDKYLRLPHA